MQTLEQAKKRLVAAEASFDKAMADLDNMPIESYWNGRTPEYADAFAAKEAAKAEYKLALDAWYAASGEKDPLANIFND